MVHPNHEEQGILDVMRIFGSLIFICDLGCKWAYYKNSKYISVYVYNFYNFFLYMRIGFIVLYHIYRATCMSIKLRKDAKSDFKKRTKTFVEKSVITV
jgi:hypothetical protein